MSALIKNTGPHVLTKTWYVDGTATDVGDVTVGVTDSTGAVVVASGTATTNNTDGTYTYTLASQTAVKMLTVTWTRADTSATLVDTVEVAGGQLFTEAQARAFDLSALTSATTYTDNAIAVEHDRIADLLEQWTGRSWIGRYRYAKLAGTASRNLYLDDILWSTGPSNGDGAQKDVIEVITANDGSTVTTSNIVLTGRNLYRTDATWTVATASNPQNVTIQYEYGMPHLVDGVDRIALLLLRERIVASNIPDRTSRFTDELGTYTLTTPGIGGAVSTVPEVNAWVKTHDTRTYIGL